jgi:hypothetical protein
MLLAEELLALTEKLEATASLKELTFYRHLIGTPLDYPRDNDLSEQEQVVFAAFCKRGPQNHLLAEKIRGTKPIKGMHYSTNLIELAAFARFSLAKETENLKNYATAHSTKEFFVLSKLFPDVLEYPPSAFKEIDRIALKLINGGLHPEDTPAIASAIQAAEDLLDVYVLKSAYQHLLVLQPATQYRRDATELAKQLSRVIRRVDVTVRILVTVATAYGLFRLYQWLVPLIVSRWNEIEPITFVIQLIFGSLALLVVAVIGTQPDKLKFLNLTFKFLGTIILKLIGISRSDAEKRFGEYLKENEIGLPLLK